MKDTKVTRVTSDTPAASPASTEQVESGPASAASPAQQPAMITARGLRKSYGAKGSNTVEAVKGIDVEVRKGEAFGFLGPNGAGKSSTMKMIAAVSPVTGGTLQILGMDPAVDGSAIRARLGVCPQEDTLDNELTVADNLIVYGRYFGLSRAEAAERTAELLSFVQLTEKSKAKVEDLSGGMKRRLTIARSLINNPDLLLLDEPTTGLDPQARHQLWDRLFRLKQQGVTLVLTTHYMDEAEQLCDRLVVMDKGVIVAEGSPLQLICGALDPRGARAAIRRRRQRVDGRQGRGPGRPGRGAARPAAALHPRWRRRLRRCARSGAAPPVVAGTSSHSRGRVPAPHRTDAGRLMTITPSSPSPPPADPVDTPSPPPADAPARARPTLADLTPRMLPRLGDYWQTVYRRTWRGSVVTSFFMPFLYLTAMGVGLGSFVDSNSGPSALDGVSYLSYIAPGLLATTALRPRSGSPRIRSWAASSGTGSTSRRPPPRCGSPTSWAAR